MRSSHFSIHCIISVFVLQKRDRRSPLYTAATKQLKERIGNVAPARLAEMTDFCEAFALIMHERQASSARVEYAYHRMPQRHMSISLCRHVAPPGDMAEEFGANIRFVGLLTPIDDPNEDVNYVDEFKPRAITPPAEAPGMSLIRSRASFLNHALHDSVSR